MEKRWAQGASSWWSSWGGGQEVGSRESRGDPTGDPAKHLATEIKATKVGGHWGNNAQQTRPLHHGPVHWQVHRLITSKAPSRLNIRSPRRHEGLGDGTEARSHTHRRRRTPPHKQARKQRKKGNKNRKFCNGEHTYRRPTGSVPRVCLLQMRMELDTTGT
jgi:hypothetical protein